jgi:hypothetical protein
MEEVTITKERYEQLIRAEHDANQLKSVIEDACNSYSSIDYNCVSMLRTIYIGKKEDIIE